MMAHFKRWTAGLVTRVDSIVVQIENQEALVESAILDLSQRVARARVQLTRVRKDGDALRRGIEETERESTLWRDRARTEPDQDRALECLRRAHRASARHAELTERAAEHERAEQRLRRDVATIEQRLDVVREQRNTMRTRQTRAEALALLRSAQGETGYEVEQVLERWDARVTETEIVAGCAEDAYDPFVEQFEREEAGSDLLAELEALRKDQRA